MSSAADAPHQAEPQAAASSFSWDALLKWSAFLITIGGLALHVAGSRYHEARIAAWGLEADLFPKPVEWVLMTGYDVIVGAIISIYLYLKTNWWMLALWGIVGFVAVMLVLHNKEDVPKRILRTWLKRLPRWLLTFGFGSSYVSLICVFVLYSPLLFAALLYLPAQLGKEAGDKTGNTEVTQYSKGCEISALKQRCIVFRRDGQPELKGFLIESSDSQLAIYLPEQKQVQVMRRDSMGLVILSYSDDTE
ncbi:hypothetical protein [Uliginosibacterium sediminicola]|uniref:Uncharacterized protein n=1 Tax=Uliginosibacterium sediminicola TaxID=2024550 RepID=A0ABU9Z334_9RHOO